jgi:acetolactate synthase-1/2/3 large subunit
LIRPPRSRVRWTLSLVGTDLQEHTYGNRILDTEFTFQPDLAAVAEARGCHGERVDRPEDVRPALERALKANRDGQPALVDVAVARARMSQTREHHLTTLCRSKTRPRL